MTHEMNWGGDRLKAGKSVRRLRVPGNSSQHLTRTLVAMRETKGWVTVHQRGNC